MTELPPACPACNAVDSFAACGPGVERVLEEAKQYFPEARIVVLASDTADSQDALRAILQDIRDHKYDIIIGTQIIAKGHHFPKLTLVGVIDADLGLQGGDLRAAERTYQLLHQVAGRAGREERPGTVYLQTFYPENKVMLAMTNHERDVFLDVEAQEREAAHMPPYSRLVGIIVAGKNEQQVLDIAMELGKTAPHAEGIRSYGPAEAPFYRLRGYYRRRLLVQADKTLDVQKAVGAWVDSVKTPSAVRVYIDIDPQSFL
jgi:primosomal protein N' (replication factor Y)